MVDRKKILNIAESSGFSWLSTKDFSDELCRFASVIEEEEKNRCLRIVKNGCGDSVIAYGLSEAIKNGDDE